MLVKNTTYSYLFQSELVDDGHLFVVLNSPLLKYWNNRWATSATFRLWLLILYFQQWGVSIQFFYRYLVVVR